MSAGTRSRRPVRTPGIGHHSRWLPRVGRPKPGIFAAERCFSASSQRGHQSEYHRALWPLVAAIRKIGIAERSPQINETNLNPPSDRGAERGDSKEERTRRLECTHRLLSMTRNMLVCASFGMFFRRVRYRVGCPSRTVRSVGGSYVTDCGRRASIGNAAR